MRDSKTSILATALLAIGCAVPGAAAAATIDLGDTFFGDPRAGGGEADLLPGDLQGLADEAAEALAASRFEATERHARRLTEDAPQAPQGWYLLGLALANLERWDEAIAALDEAAGRYEINAQPLFVKGEILQALGRSDAARAAFEAAAERDPDHWLAQEKLGEIAVAGGDVQAAIAHFARAAAVAPQDEFAPQRRLAELTLAAGDAETAERVVEEFLAANVPSVEALTALGHVRMVAGDAAGAVEPLSTARDMAGGRTDVALLLGRAQKASGRLEEARETFRAAHEAAPGNVEIAFELGNLEGALRNYPAALDAYAAGLEASPGNRTLTKAASLAHVRAGTLDEALSLAEALARREDRTSADLVWLATVQDQLGATDEAIRSYEAALDLDAGNWLAANNLAANLTEREPERAVALAREALDRSGGVPEVADTLGWALRSAARLDQAEAVYVGLVEDAPETPHYRYRLGRILLDLGRTEDGRMALRDALALDPEFPQADEARRLLGASAP